MAENALVLGSDPIKQFENWFQKAMEGGQDMADAMSLATVTSTGEADVRIVLYKGLSEGGICFFTNLESPKSRQLEVNPSAALVFYWPSVKRQVRMQGSVEPVNREESNSYAQSRPRESQISAWASPQSEVIKSREVLLEKVRRFEQEFKDGEIPCPPFWGGYRLIPKRIEFWENRDSRLHERLCYTLKDGQWSQSRLAP